MGKNVRIFSTPTCSYCVFLKNYLNEKGVEYEEIDVSKDEEKLKEMVDLSGQMGVPVTQIGEEVIIGFNKKEIESLLDI